MDKSRLTVTTTPQRSASISSTISRAETFHSFSTAPALLDEDQEALVWSKKENMAYSRRNRADSGFESMGGTRTPDSDWEQKTITPRIKHRYPCRIEGNKPKFERAHTASDIPRPSTSPHGSGSHSSGARRRHRDSQPSYSRHTSRHSSRRSSFAQSQTNPPPYLLTRHSAQTDPYTAHQRALSIFQALEPKTSPPIPAIPGQLHKSLSNTTLPTNQPFDYSSDRPSSISEEPKLSLHHQSTTIDWTDPSSRRRAYAKHDAKRRGVEGIWRRVRKLWPGKMDEEVKFYKEKVDDDACSVRRYRLDLTDEDEKSYEKSCDHRGRASERGWKLVWRDVSCFSDASGMVEGKS